MSESRVHNIPWEWQHVVCTCDKPRSSTDPEWGPKCTNCGKISRWVLRPCMLCKVPYLALFHHPAMCRTGRSTCWTCLEAHGGWEGHQKQSGNNKKPCACPSCQLLPPIRKIFNNPSWAGPRRQVALVDALNYDLDLDF